MRRLGAKREVPKDRPDRAATNIVAYQMNCRLGEVDEDAGDRAGPEDRLSVV